MNQEQTNITTGKQIRHLRTQLGMTQEELAGELNVTRQALSNWERDVNEPDLNMLKKICFLFGVNMDDFAKEVITKMETYEKKEKRQFNKYDMAIGLFYGVGIFLGIGIFFVGEDQRRNSLPFILHRYSSADKPREFEGRALKLRHAANLSSK